MTIERRVETGDNTAMRSFVANFLKIAFSAKGFAAIAAVFVIAVLLSVIAKFGISLAVLALGAVISILLAVLYLCFSWISRLKNKSRSFLARLSIYSATFVVCGPLLVGFSSSVFDQPLPLKAYIIARLGTDDNRRVLTAERTESSIARALVKNRKITRIILSETGTSRGISNFGLIAYPSQTMPSMGFHFIVDRNGFTYPMNNIDQVVWHTMHHDEDSVGIGLEHTPRKVYSAEQISSLEKLLGTLVQRLEIEADAIYSKEEIKPAMFMLDVTPFLPRLRRRINELIQQKR